MNLHQERTKRRGSASGVIAARFRRSWFRVLVVVSVAAALTGVRAEAAQAASGTISVTPMTILVDGQTVGIDGRGWVPGAQIGFCEALALNVFPSAGACSNGTYSVATADGSGNFTGALVVQRHFFSPAMNRTIDCNDPTTPCYVGAADINNFVNTIALVSIAFAPPVVVPGSGSVLEGTTGTTTNLNVPVALSTVFAQTVTAQWTTVYVPGAPGNQAETTDYTPTSGTVTFAPGQTTQSVTISVNGDTLVEPTEYIVVAFHDPTNATIGGYWGLGFGTITNNNGT
jgi:fibronectin-binding autotransporter adhesin